MARLQDEVEQGEPVSKVCIYESSVDIEHAVTSSYRMCAAGHALGLGGAAAAGLSLLPLGPPLAALLAAAAAAAAYSGMVGAPQALRWLAAPHVERILVVLPAEHAAAAAAPQGREDGHGERKTKAEDEAADRLLAAVPELWLEVASASALHALLLAAPAAPRSRLLPGARLDARPRLRDLCVRPSWDGGPARSSRRGPLHVAPEAARSADRALLEALLRSDKVVAHEEAWPREDVAAVLRRLEAAEPEELLVTAPSNQAGGMDAPHKNVERYGRQSLLRGGALLAAGLGLFVIYGPASPGDRDGSSVSEG